MQEVENQLRSTSLRFEEDEESASALAVLKRCVSRGESVPKDVISKLASLTELDLGQIDIGPRHVKSFARALPGLRYLTVLKMANNELEAPGVEILAKSFCSAPSITSLDLSYNDLRDQGALKLAQYLPCLPGLSELFLTCNGIREEGTKTLVKQGLGGLVFLEGFTKLELTGNRIGSGGATSLGKLMPKLEGLTLLGMGGGFVGAEGTSSIGSSIPESLSHLNLQGNRCGTHSARIVVESASSKLLALDLGGNKLGRRSENVRDRDTLFSSSSKRVRYDSGGEPPSDDEDENIVSFASALALKASLTDLSLANNALDDDFVATVAQFLPCMRSLTSLNLSLNLMTTFHEQFCHHTSLTAIDVSFNGIKQLPQHIGKLFKSLKKLDLRRNQLTTLPKTVAKLNRDCDLCLVANPLRDPPLAVAEKGVRAIRRYFERQNQLQSTTSVSGGDAAPPNRQDQQLPLQRQNRVEGPRQERIRSVPRSFFPSMSVPVEPSSSEHTQNRANDTHQRTSAAFRGDSVDIDDMLISSKVPSAAAAP